MERTDTEIHLGIGKEYDFDGEKHIIKPLGSIYFGHITRLINAVQKKFKGKVPTGEDMISLFIDRELMKDMAEMVDATLADIFPAENKDVINAFASKNMFYLFQAVIEQNMPKMNKEDMTKAQKILARQKLHDESVNKNKKSE